LSFTTFEVTGTSEATERAGELGMSVEVANTGARIGATVVQLYARVAAAPVVRPVRQLLDFARVELAPGDSAEVWLGAPVTRLAYTGLDGARRLPDGLVTLSVGLASDDIRTSSSIEAPGSAHEGSQ
jgi:beta-glucosidase